MVISNRTDCRPEFAAAFQIMEERALEGFYVPALWTPFIFQTKTDIARDGSQLKVPYHLTWSCYEGGALHCGQCGTCVERKEAFRDAGLKDPTVYALNMRKEGSPKPTTSSPSPA